MNRLGMSLITAMGSARRERAFPPALRAAKGTILTVRMVLAAMGSTRTGRTFLRALRAAKGAMLTGRTILDVDM